MEEKHFNLPLSSLRLGLVRLNGEFVIIDKNRVADAIFPLPKRGASVKKFLGATALRFCDLPKSAGCACAVTLKRDNVSKNAVAIRENDGTALLMLHPLFSKFHISSTDERNSKIFSAYSMSVYGIIKEMENETAFPSHQISSVFSDFFLSSVFGGGYYSVEEAIDRLLNKLSYNVTGKSILINVDKRYSVNPFGVIYSELEYAMGEILAIRERYGKKKVAELKIVVEDNWFKITLEDSIEDDKTTKYYIRIATEMLKVMGLGSHACISVDGNLTFNAYIPYEKKDGILHCDMPFTGLYI